MQGIQSVHLSEFHSKVAGCHGLPRVSQLTEIPDRLLFISMILESAARALPLCSQTRVTAMRARVRLHPAALHYIEIEKRRLSTHNDRGLSRCRGLTADDGTVLVLRTARYGYWFP